MQRLVKLGMVSALLVALAAPGAARAQEGETYAADTSGPVRALVNRAVTLNQSVLGLYIQLHINLSKDLVGKPVALVPSIYYGVSPDLTLGLAHGRSDMTLAVPSNGICLTGKENGCAKAYNALSLDVLYRILKGNLGMALHGGVDFHSLDPFYLGLRVGVLGHWSSGKIGLTFDPALYIGLSKRDEGNKEQLDLPVRLEFQLTPEFAAYILAGIAGPLDHFGDFWTGALGLGALYSVSPAMDLGLEFIFENLYGKNSSGDSRGIILFFNWHS